MGSVAGGWGVVDSRAPSPVSGSSPWRMACVTSDGSDGWDAWVVIYQKKQKGWSASRQHPRAWLVKVPCCKWWSPVRINLWLNSRSASACAKVVLSNFASVSIQSGNSGTYLFIVDPAKLLHQAGNSLSTFSPANPQHKITALWPIRS